MQLRLLGVHNTETRDHRMASALIDGVLALDAGALAGSLTLDEQARVEAVLLSHRHFDHIRDLATVGMNTRGVTSTALVALPEVHADLQAHVLNGVIWSQLYQRPDTEHPTLREVPLRHGESVEVAGYRVTATPTRHSAPSCGFLVERDGRRLFFSGDTGTGVVAGLLAVSTAPVHTMVVEVTYPDAEDAMAEEQGHLTPARLETELLELSETAGRPHRVLVVHRDPRYEAQLGSELNALGERRGWPIELPATGAVYEI